MLKFSFAAITNSVVFYSITDYILKAFCLTQRFHSFQPLDQPLCLFSYLVQTLHRNGIPLRPSLTAKCTLDVARVWSIYVTFY